MMPAPASAPLDIGGAPGSRAHSRAVAAASASASSESKKLAPASLRRVEQLLQDGERLPFELTKVSHNYVLFRFVLSCSTPLDVIGLHCIGFDWIGLDCIVS